mmetsp:Transcript_11144/g.13179  ORF Transcript_11144/g.13179 Transcript_11144/m.13179 type:complete len:274 (-) Transcript_11144:794-1615(-)
MKVRSGQVSACCDRHPTHHRIASDTPESSRRLQNTSASPSDTLHPAMMATTGHSPTSFLVNWILRSIGPRTQLELVHISVPVILPRKQRSGRLSLDRHTFSCRNRIPSDDAHVTLRLALVAPQRRLIGLRTAVRARTHGQRLVHLLVHTQSQHPITNLFTFLLGHIMLLREHKVVRNVRIYKVGVLDLVARVRVLHRFRQIQVAVQKHKRHVHLSSLLARDTSFIERLVSRDHTNVTKQGGGLLRREVLPALALASRLQDGIVGHLEKSCELR